MVDPNNMRIKQRNESFSLQAVRFVQFPCRRLRRIGKSLRFRLQELSYAADQFLHLIQPDIFSRLVCVVITGTEVDRSEIQLRCQNGNVAEAPERRLKPKSVDILLKLSVAALIEYGVVAAHAIQFHNIIDVRFDSGLYKSVCAVTASFLIFAE